MTGTVKKKTDRGFGFISIDGQDKDLFFHSSELSGVTFDNLSEGATVSFDVADGPDGRQSAKNVKLADGNTEAAPAEEAGAVEETAVEEPAEAATADEAEVTEQATAEEEAK